MTDKLIERDMTIGDAVKAYPQVANVFLKFGLHCVGCHVAYWETVEQGCRDESARFRAVPHTGVRTGRLLAPGVERRRG